MSYTVLIEACAQSQIPYFVAGSFDWNCSTENGQKNCGMKCTDDYNVGVSASCALADDTWFLSSDLEGLSVWNAGCQTCTANPLVKFPIGEGGKWECDISNISHKTCLPKCENGKEILGEIGCDRKKQVFINCNFIFQLASSYWYL